MILGSPDSTFRHKIGPLFTHFHRTDARTVLRSRIYRLSRSLPAYPGERGQAPPPPIYFYDLQEPLEFLRNLNDSGIPGFPFSAQNRIPFRPFSPRRGQIPPTGPQPRRRKSQPAEAVQAPPRSNLYAHMPK